MPKFTVMLSPRKEKDDEAQREDRISELPEDLMFTFLSRLDMKEAVQTSILSKKWRYVWTELSDLDFDHLKYITPEYDWFGINKFELQKPLYLDWVHQVVSAHRGPYIDNFRIVFPLAESDSNHINTWVSFAISKRVKKLELDFKGYMTRKQPPLYMLGFDILKPPLCDGSICFLTSLHLRYVNVSGEVLEYILSRCQLLERLFVYNSKDLVSFKVMDSSYKCKLKHLTIFYCQNLKELEIHADYLEYFEFYDADFSPGPNMVFKSVPLLTEATFGEQCCSVSLPIFRKIACITQQLSTLTLDLQVVDVCDDISDTLIPSFPNVNHLKLRICAYPTISFLIFTRFVEACPVLCELKLEVYWADVHDVKDIPLPEASEVLEMDPGSEFKHGGDDDDDDDDEHCSSNSYPTLRVLELVGFLGSYADVDFVMYIVDHALNLHTIVCDTHCYCVIDSTEEVGPPDLKEISRTRARKLARILPPQVTTIII